MGWSAFGKTKGGKPITFFQWYDFNKIEAQPDFGKVYSVKGENMGKFVQAFILMVCRPMFWWSGPPGATKMLPQAI